MFMLLQRAAPSVMYNSLAAVVGLSANVMALVTASFLGRSLSVMPEARRLVQDGPYGIVRHPLYLCELDRRNAGHRRCRRRACAFEPPFGRAATRRRARGVGISPRQPQSRNGEHRSFAGADPALSLDGGCA